MTHLCSKSFVLCILCSLVVLHQPLLQLLPAACAGQTQSIQLLLQLTGPTDKMKTVCVAAICSLRACGCGCIAACLKAIQQNVSAICSRAKHAMHM